MNEYCDNTDHKGKHIDIKLTRLTEEFGYSLCSWCGECRKRDKDMILHNFNF